MGPIYWFTWLWPGSAEAWQGGKVRGLVTAMMFAAVLNGAILMTLNWQSGAVENSPNTWLVVVSWLVVATFFSGGLIQSSRTGRGGRDASTSNPETAGMFCKAQTEYLRGHWIEA